MAFKNLGSRDVYVKTTTCEHFTSNFTVKFATLLRNKETRLLTMAQPSRTRVQKTVEPT